MYLVDNIVYNFNNIYCIYELFKDIIKCFNVENM